MSQIKRWYFGFSEDGSDAGGPPPALWLPCVASVMPALAKIIVPSIPALETGIFLALAIVLASVVWSRMGQPPG